VSPPVATWGSVIWSSPNASLLNPDGALATPLTNPFLALRGGFLVQGATYLLRASVHPNPQVEGYGGRGVSLLG
jgi:hypothetical protein